MEKENKIEKIRLACVAANPEIVELKFGCQIMLKEGIGSYKTAVYTVLDMVGAKVRFIGMGGIEKASPGGFNIIGRPIRLTDVLLAIMVKSDYQNPTNTELFDLICGYWNLRKDSLTDQSDETISFIASVV